jgi:hypothetical protein
MNEEDRKFKSAKYVLKRYSRGYFTRMFFAGL